ncbi:MAG: HD domain-containing protein [Verrucomicrobia bacterium]|nr:HD domain-containing protein [Verrucomicrobiota bacterium]
MRALVNTRDPAAVESEVQAAYQAMFPYADRTFVSKAFFWAQNCFIGNYRDYQAIDARYHDFEHTLQGTLCMIRLLHGRHVAKAQPELTQRMFKLGLLAILLHDTGYLKTKDDTEGTGAKYTLIHVNRSAEFAALLLSEKAFGPKDILAVQDMIRCTGVNVDLNVLRFQDELERTVGFALGTADLLGQMAASDYVEKLPILYQEFAESEQFNAGTKAARAVFSSAQDLIQKTPAFWSKYVMPRVERDFQGLYHYLNQPYPDGPNYYLKCIEANIDRVQRMLAATPV